MRSSSPPARPPVVHEGEDGPDRADGFRCGAVPDPDGAIASSTSLLVEGEEGLGNDVDDFVDVGDVDDGPARRRSSLYEVVDPVLAGLEILEEQIRESKDLVDGKLENFLKAVSIEEGHEVTA